MSADTAPNFADGPEDARADSAADTEVSGAAPAGDASSLARRQAELAAALTLGAPPPTGFDATAVTDSARGLVAKRAAELQAQFPQLAAELGAGFVPAVAEWGREHPRGGPNSSATDLALWWAARAAHRPRESGAQPPQAAASPAGRHGSGPSRSLAEAMAVRAASRRRWWGLTTTRVGARRFWLLGTPRRPRLLG